jgi:hypothetical protein
MRNSSIAAVFVMCIALSLTLVAPGCGGSSSPDTAVRNLFQAINNGDWDAFLGSVLPERVRVMSDTEMQTQKEQIKKKSEGYTDLKMKVEYDKKNKDVATVVITGGKISHENPTTGQKETVIIEDYVKQYPEQVPTIKVRKFKGRWYADIQLSGGEEQPQQAPEPGQ